MLMLSHSTNPEQDANLLMLACIVFPLLYYVAAFSLTYVLKVPSKFPFWDAACNQGSTILGIPFSCFASVLILKTFQALGPLSGTLKVEATALGFHFEGPAGPILLWTICFLSFVVSIRLLSQ